MAATKISIAEAKQIDLVDYLKTIGFEPERVRGNDYWYCSPLREEKEASFKINRKINAWYDFGIGQGGTIIDFGIHYYKEPIRALLQRLATTHTPRLPSFQPHQARAIGSKDATEKKLIEVIAAKPVASTDLCRYLNERRIPLPLADRYCKEITFSLKGKRYHAIGFQNNSGGYELRTPYFKGSSSPKDITCIEVENAKDISVFEGFFDFLSYLAITENQETRLTNFLVLNSLAFFPKQRELMEKNEQVHLFLDRDKAGRKMTHEALSWNKNYRDESQLYRNYKDLNDLVRNQKMLEQRSQIKNHPGRHLPPSL